MNRAYHARIAASKARLDNEMRAIVAEMRGESILSVAVAIKRRTCAAIDSGYLRQLMAETS